MNDAVLKRLLCLSMRRQHSFHCRWLIFMFHFCIF